VLNLIEKYEGRLAGVAGFIAAFLTFGMMALIFVDVVGRFFFDKPIFGSYELVQMGMGLLVFYALPYAQYRKGLVRVDFIVNKFPVLMRKIIWAAGDVISTVVAYALAYACFYHGVVILANSGAKTSVLLMPLYPFYYAAALALLIFAVVLTADTIIAISYIFRKEDPLTDDIQAQL
jgi:TRAP-type C4-dicarboxylate transport system permease small subunit